MIIKVMPAREATASSSDRLVDYVARIADYIAQKGSFEDPDIWAENFTDNETLEFCKLEFQDTINMNTTSNADKVLHVIVSYPDEDKEAGRLSMDLHKKITEEVCETLELQDHQRICAIHTDSNSGNEHIHIVVNKVNPERYNVVDPYFSGLKVGKLAEELEAKYDLTFTNHERRSGINNSFPEYVTDTAKESLKEIIDNKGSWQQIQDELANYNLHIRKRGNGLVVSDKEQKRFVKLSAVVRGAKSLGKFDPSITSDRTPILKFIPEKGKENSNELWNSYQELKDKKKDELTEIHKEFKNRRTAVYSAHRKHSKIAKDDTTLKGPARAKRFIFLKAERKKVLDQLAQEKEKRIKETGTGNWLDYLAQQYNDHDNLDALSQLKKSRVFNPELQNNAEAPEVEPFSKTDKAGNTFTEVGKDKVYLIDNQLKTNSNDIAVATKMLQIAAEKFTGVIKVDGTQEFKQAILTASRITGIEVGLSCMEPGRQSTQERDVER